MIKYKIRCSDWLTLPLIIVYYHFFTQPSPGEVLTNCYSLFYHLESYEINSLEYLTLPKCSRACVRALCRVPQVYTLHGTKNSFSCRSVHLEEEEKNKKFVVSTCDCPDAWVAGTSPFRKRLVCPIFDICLRSHALTCEMSYQ